VITSRLRTVPAYSIYSIVAVVCVYFFIIWCSLLARALYVFLNMISHFCQKNVYVVRSM